MNRVGFSKGTTGTTKMESELASSKLFSLLSGSTISTSAGTILKRETFLVSTARTFTLAETPTSVIGVGTVLADGITESKSFTIETGTVAAAGKAIINGTSVIMNTGDADVKSGDTLVVFYLYSEASVDKFTVTAKPHSTYYEIYADVAIKYDADGSEDFVQIHIFKAKAKEDLVLTFSSDNPSKYSVETDMFGDSAYQVDGVDGMYEWSQIN